MSIGENYVGKLTPMRSNISRFSRGTVCDGQRKRGLALRCPATSRQRRRPQMANLANFWNSEKSVKLFRIWWTRGDSNPRPPRCERGALPAELLAHEQRIHLSKAEMGCQDTVSRTQSRNSKSKTLDSKLTAFRVLANQEELRW